MICNNLMKQLVFKDQGYLSPREITAADKKITELTEKLVCKNGCLYFPPAKGSPIADEELISEKTQLEAWYNEILLNSEFGAAGMRITPQFATQFFIQFNMRLRENYDHKFCSILSEDHGRWTFRFHIVREDEGLWISEDMKNSSQPIMYTIFDKNGEIK